MPVAVPKEPPGKHYAGTGLRLDFPMPSKKLRAPRKRLPGILAQHREYLESHCHGRQQQERTQQLKMIGQPANATSATTTTTTATTTTTTTAATATATLTPTAPAAPTALTARFR